LGGGGGVGEQVQQAPRPARGEEGDRRWDIIGRGSGTRSARNAASNARTVATTSASAATSKLSLLLLLFRSFATQV
jgi:hypothetical protein